MIGVATSKSPVDMFKAETQPIAGASSMDAAVFAGVDGQSFMGFGDFWNWQPQRWVTGRFDPNGTDDDLLRDGKWWLFHADTPLSNTNHLRNAKGTVLRFNLDGTIAVIAPSLD